MGTGSLLGIALWALIPGFIARKKGRSFWGYFFLSFLLSPLISMIITLCVKDLKNEDHYEHPTDTTQSFDYEVMPPANPDSANTRVWQCSCGRFHPKDENSCICGKPKTYIPTSVPVETALPETPASRNRILYCWECGDKLLENSNFCRKCGTEVAKKYRG